MSAKGRAVVTSAAALVFYATASVLVFGRDVVLTPSTSVVGDDGADKTIPMWSFVWWPHALGRGHDPFDADVVWAPGGIDLSWVTAVPGPSIVAAPLTALVGPVATYNILVLLAPALAAWTAYLLARWITQAFWPSLIAGWIFGFSAYQIGHMIGHLNLVLIFLVPVCALLVLRHVTGEITTRRFVVLFGLTLAGQMLISTEIALTLVLVGALFAVLALWREAVHRAAVRRTVAASAYGVGVACALAAPLLVHAFLLSGRDNTPIRSPFKAATDLLNYVVPTRRIWLQFPGSSEIAERFTANGAERGGYLGLALIAIVALFALAKPRLRARSLLLLGLLGLVIASLGSEIRVAGHGFIPGPWKLPAKLPVTETVLPTRLTMYVSLVVAIITAIWLQQAGRGRRWPWGLALVAIATTLVNPAHDLWTSRTVTPSFFTARTYQEQIRPSETVLVLPYGGSGWSLLWQAETGMAFRMVGGHMGRKTTPRERRWLGVYEALGSGPLPENIEETFRQFLSAHAVKAVIVGPDTNPRARRIVESLGVEPSLVGGVALFRL